MKRIPPPRSGRPSKRFDEVLTRTSGSSSWYSSQSDPAPYERRSYCCAPRFYCGSNGSGKATPHFAYITRVHHSHSRVETQPLDRHHVERGRPLGMDRGSRRHRSGKPGDSRELIAAENLATRPGPRAGGAPVVAHLARP